MSNCKTCIWEACCGTANGNLSNDCTRYCKKASPQATTYIRIFRGDSSYQLERESNEYAEENNVDIIRSIVLNRHWDFVVQKSMQKKWQENFAGGEFLP